MDVTRKKPMKYEDIKKMGEAYAQVQEKMRLENVKRAEAMVQAEAKKIETEMSDMEKTRAMASNPPKKDKQDTKNRPNPEMRGEAKIDEKGPKVVNKDVSVKGIAKASDKYAQQNNDASNDKSDDGDGMDKVSSKSAKKKFGDRKDKDIDNDGDVDSSDQFLHKRRKAISKNSDSKGKKEVEVQTSEKVKEDTVDEAASTGKGKNSDSTAQDKEDGLSPNAKKELARATKEPAVDAEKSNKLNFATFKKMTKKSKDNG
jgi:hypothetical protein